MLNLTPRAADKVKEIRDAEGLAGQGLRVRVIGGGCAGFSYGFKFDEEAKEDDTQVENQGVTLLVDPMSIQYLAGSEVDYTEGLQGAQFVVKNPNATSTCGCGSSFSI